MTAHLRLNAVYWGLVALCIMGHKDALDRDEMVEFVMSCWDDEAGSLQSLRLIDDWIELIKPLGGFGAHPDHDAHIHSTLSAIQILTIHNAMARLDIARGTECMKAPLRCYTF